MKKSRKLQQAIARQQKAATKILTIAHKSGMVAINMVTAEDVVEAMEKISSLDDATMTRVDLFYEEIVEHVQDRDDEREEKSFYELKRLTRELLDNKKKDDTDHQYSPKPDKTI